MKLLISRPQTCPSPLKVSSHPFHYYCCCYYLVARTFNIRSTLLTHFKYIVLLAIVVVLYSRSSELILYNWNLVPCTATYLSPPLPSLSNHKYSLCFYNFDYFRLHILVRAFSYSPLSMVLWACCVACMCGGVHSFYG